MIALAVGTLLTLAALALVLYPLFVQQPLAGVGAHSKRTEAGSDSALAALREVEFDRETGKLSPEDYQELKAAYMVEAVAAMRAEERSGRAASAGGAARPVSDEELEAVIRHFRGRAVACSSCGPRPEADAAYCSTCGRFLAGTCPRCSAAVREPGASFCGNCGASLKALSQIESARAS